MKLAPGFTFHWKAENSRNSHLYIVLSDFLDEGLEAVVVNITTKHKGSDLTLELRQGDHPFIIHDSCVFYAEAGLVTEPQLIEMKVKPAEALDREILVRMQEGIHKSSFTPKVVKKFCKKHGIGIMK